MDGVHPDISISIDLREERAISYDPESIDSLISSLWLVVVVYLLDILFESATMGYIEELHSSADSEDWPMGELDLSHSIEEISIICWHDTSCSIGGLPIENWIDIRTSREYESITHIDI